MKSSKVENKILSQYSAFFPQNFSFATNYMPLFSKSCFII